MKVTRYLKCQMTLDTIGTIHKPCSVNKIMYIREGLSADQSEGFVRYCVTSYCVSPKGSHDI